MKEGENSLCYEIYIKDYEKDKEIQAGDNGVPSAETGDTKDKKRK